MGCGELFPTQGRPEGCLRQGPPLPVGGPLTRGHGWQPQQEQSEAWDLEDEFTGGRWQTLRRRALTDRLSAQPRGGGPALDGCRTL